MPATAAAPWTRAGRILLVACGAFALVFAASAAPSVGVAVLHNSEWSPDDPTRDGAGEFEVWLRVAQLRRTHSATGLIAMGDREGFIRSGGERALRRVVFAGVVVVKQARGGKVAATPDGLFLDAGTLSEEKTRRLLVRALARYGSPPAATDPERPTVVELSAIRAHLEKIQALFSAEGGTTVALR